MVHRGMTTDLPGSWELPGSLTKLSGRFKVPGWPAGLAAALLISLAVALPALAGGWAVITLDRLPGEVTAGQPLSVGFMVRQHGQRPLPGLAPTVTLQHIATGQTFTVTAAAEGQPGHYTASLTLPEVGQWRWSIQAFTIEQPLPPLTVVMGAPAAPKTGELPLAPLLLGFAGLGGAGLVWWRTRTWWAPGIVLAAALAGGLGLAARPGAPGRVEAAAQPPVAQVETGRALVAAKGCLTCHRHREVEWAPTIQVDEGPSLADLALTPAYLRLWLKDPAGVKPTTKMPNLNLSDDEIEALAAFLSTGRASGNSMAD